MKDFCINICKSSNNINIMFILYERCSAEEKKFNKSNIRNSFIKYKKYLTIVEITIIYTFINLIFDHINMDMFKNNI